MSTDYRNIMSNRKPRAVSRNQWPSITSIRTSVCSVSVGVDTSEPYQRSRSGRPILVDQRRRSSRGAVAWWWLVWDPRGLVLDPRGLVIVTRHSHRLSAVVGEGPVDESWIVRRGRMSIGL